VFPVFEAGGGMGLPEMGGAGNFVMVADPETFRVLPWAENTGWLLCDCYFPNGKQVPIATR
jgi:glutamine synthetase